jgi:hypothetical protein
MTDIPGTITVTVPFTIRHHGGRKQVITPDGRPALAPPRARVDSALVKALGRAFRWRRLLDTGAYATIEEIATAEGINPSYVSRVEPLRVCRRLQPLRGWSNEDIEELLA